MALTNNEKQAIYRQRKLEAGAERVQAIISLQAKRGLERLARHNGLSQTAMLERLILEEQSRVTAKMEGDAYRVYIGETVTA
jgi:hypothetical protein